MELERRRNARFALNLPMTVRWTNNSGTAEAETVSRDVCSTGVYFWLSGEHFSCHEIEAGSRVEIVLTLPHEVTHDGGARVRCYGHVLRIHRIDDSCCGVAARIEDYRFERGIATKQELSVA